MEDNTKNTIDVFNKNAELYQKQFMNVDLYADTLDIFCNQVSKRKASILEVGCGPANVTKYLINKRPDFEILATDLSARMLELAKKTIPNVEFKILDLRDIGSLGKRFNGIVCGFCLPYLSKKELEQFFSDASKLLTDNGILFISTMEGNNEKSGFKQSSSGKGISIFINYYMADYLIQILERNSFKIIDQKRKVYKDKKENNVTDLIIIAKKNVAERSISY